MVSKTSLSLACVTLFVGYAASTFLAFPSVTLGVGGVSYFASSTAVAQAVAGLSALAITKELLTLASLKRRGRRDAHGDHSVELTMSSLIDSLDENDERDCSKMAVCTIASMPAEGLTASARKIAELFRPGQTSATDLTGARGKFLVAASFGQSFGADACMQRYRTCAVEPMRVIQILGAASEQPALIDNSIN